MDAYYKIMSIAGNALKDKYQSVLNYLESKYREEVYGNTSRLVWFCWLQGLEEAPELVNICYDSLRRHITDREIVVLSNENIKQYADLPEFVLKKHEKGIIPDAAFTDMLRLELLCKYGGTWIDATVLCTGGEGINEILDADLFVFQQTRKGTVQFLGMSSWMMSSVANNSFLLVVRDMLYEYWKEKNCVMDYFLIHLFFCMMAERHPEVVAKMPKKSNRVPHYLQRRLADPYDKVWMEELKAHCAFHKLTYRVPKDAYRKGTFYDVLINKGSAL